MSTIVGRDTTDIGPRIEGISWGLTAIAGCCLGTRLYARVTQSRLWWDDHLLLASWLLLLVQASISSYAVRLGFGKHAVVVSEDNILKLVLLVSVAGVFTLLAAACSKTSFALTLLRLTNGWLRVGVWAIIITMNLSLLVNILLPFLRCSPVAAAWDPSIQGTCFDIQITIRYSIFAAAYSAVMDWLLALVPWAIIIRLNMKTKEKIGVAICMSLGFIAGATSIIRCIKIPLLESDDFTFRSGQLAIWTVAEIATTIMATSIPVLRVFLRRMVTDHPGNDGGTNPYHRSAADGTFLKSLRIASKGTEHTTTITTGGRNSAAMKHSGSWRQKDQRTIRISLEPESSCRIIKVDTVAIDYARRKSEDMLREGSTLADGGSRATSSIELHNVAKMKTYSYRSNDR